MSIEYEEYFNRRVENLISILRNNFHNEQKHFLDIIPTYFNYLDERIEFIRILLLRKDILLQETTLEIIRDNYGNFQLDGSIPYDETNPNIADKIDEIINNKLCK